MAKIEELIAAGIIKDTNSTHWSYDGSGSLHRTSSDQKYQIVLGSAQRMPSDFRSECIETAKLIYQAAKEPLSLIASGGLDSEVMVNAFLIADVPFKVYAFDFGTNEDELVHLRKLLEHRSEALIVRKVDPISLWKESDFRQICSLSGSPSVEINTIL